MYDKPDFYAIKAKQEGYVARSVYKLIEIQEKFQLIKKGQKIVDLGCAPGSWTQYVSQIVNENGIIIGIDNKTIKVNPKNAIFINGDFSDNNNKDKISKYAPFNGIISDMAPDTKGDNLSDCYSSSELVRNALDFSYKFLKKGGYFIAKIFQGGDEKEIMNEIKLAFRHSKWFKPKSCRKNSFEIYMIGIDFIKKPIIQENKFSFDESNGEMPW